MRAIVHSIHSQVPPTVEKLGEPLDLILSLDSHLDVALGGDYGVYPAELRAIAARTGAHSALRRMAGAGLVVAVPEAMLSAHATDVESRLPPSLRVSEPEESVASTVRFLAEAMGVEVYQSPPEPLTGLLPRLRRAGSWLLDVDVDYMEEMQEECYTRIFGAAPGVLQSASKVLELVTRSRPETITLSEAKVAAIRDPRSHFSRFVGELRAMGYSVEERAVYPGDAEVERGISVCREFYERVSTRQMREHMEEMMRGDMEGFRRAEAAAARSFFRTRGYPRPRGRAPGALRPGPP